MGLYKGAVISERRVYDDPQHPETSGYTVTLDMTTTDAVFDPFTGEMLSDMLQSFMSQVYASLSTKAQAGSAYTKPETDSLLLTLVGVHDKGMGSHPSILAAQAVTNSRVQALEDMVVADVQENKAYVGFATLGDVELIRGVYNAAYQRLECSKGA